MTDDIPVELRDGTGALWERRAEPMDVSWFVALDAEDVRMHELHGGLIGEVVSRDGRWFGVARADGDRGDEALVAVAADTHRDAHTHLFETAKEWASYAHRHAVRRRIMPSDRGLRMGARLDNGGVVTAIRDDGYPELDGVWVCRDE
jgi:hypothetical protein